MCRVCGREELDTVLDLGEQPLANSFLRADELGGPEPRFPLVFSRCSSCGHAQLSVAVAPEIIFRDYPYVSGTSETLRRHFAEYARDVRARFLPPQGLVVEIGSNDGTLLKGFDQAEVRVLGVEPALNIADIAKAQGVPTRTDFFDEAVARDIASTDGPADAIIANNVVAHIGDLHGLARGVSALLAERGVFVAEFPYLVDLLERVEYDTIYHEHQSYFTVRSASDLFRRFGLQLFDVRRTPIHGGSIRIFVGRAHEVTANVVQLLRLEADRGLDTPAPFLEFAKRVRRQRGELTALVGRLRAAGARLAAYGAAAKGNTLLNFCGFDRGSVQYIVDRSPLKHDLFNPGGHIPVRGVDLLVQDRPDYTLMLAWNLEEEILRQQQPYREAGGRFIVPIPLPRVV